MVDFFQNIFGKVISLMASAIIAVGLVSVPEMLKPVPVEQQKEVIVEKVEPQEVIQESKKQEAPEIENRKTLEQDGEQNKEIETLKTEIKKLESYLMENYQYIPRVRIEEGENLIDFLERQKKIYTETIEKAQKIINEKEALDRDYAEGQLIQKQIGCLEKLGIYGKVLEDIEKIKDLSGNVEEPIDTRPFIEEEYLRVENLCNE